MEWWFGGQWPNLATWLWSLASPQWKERTNLERLSSDLQMYKLACAHSHIYTKRINLIKKKKRANPTVAQLPTPFHPPPALTGSSSRVTGRPAPSVQLQSQKSNSGPESKRLQHSTSQHTPAANARRQAAELSNRSGGLSSSISEGSDFTSAPLPARCLTGN